jgi:Na+-transporting NADH:ubiquinone oxidoreductase subunit NqrB
LNNITVAMVPSKTPTITRQEADPVAGSMTNPGRWTFGLVVGVLAMVIRVANPSFTESVLFAVFLASLFSPLMDFTVIELNIRRRRRRRRLSENTDG